jgi:hypothetical protein
MKDLGSAFSFIFKDPRWVSKLLIASLFLLLSLLVVGIFFLTGYLVETSQRVMRREQYPLPTWENPGKKFVRGLKFALIYVLYLVPLILLTIPVLALTIAGEMSDNPDVFGAFSVVYSFGMTLLIVPYSLALTVLLPIIIYRFAVREKVGDALDVSAVVRDFRHNWQNTLLVALLAVGVQSFAAIGLVVLIVGVLFTILYAYLTSAYLVGALYLERRDQGAIA